VSLPTITNINQFDAVSQYMIVSGAGAHVQYDTIPSTATLNLPAVLDKTRPFQFGCLVEYGGNAQRLAVRLENPADQTWTILSCSIDSGDMRIESGTTSFLNKLAGLVAGDQFWLGISWDATGNACIWMHPVSGHTGIGDYAAYLGAVHKDYQRAIDKNYAGGSNSHGPWLEGVTRIQVQSSSEFSILRSVFARQGDFVSGPAGRIEPPLVINPVVAGDVNTWLRRPSYATPATVRDLVVVFHAANSDELTGQVENGNADDGVATGVLMNDGYMLAAMRGTNDGLMGGIKATNWGAGGPLATYWHTWIQKVRAEHGVRNVYLLGLSMGLMNALRYYKLYPSGIKAIAGVSGAANLAYAYSNEGFAAAINAAHGTAVVGDIAPVDPTQHPADYSAIPIKLWHGDADATLSLANHMDTFAAAVNAITPGGVVKVPVVGGTHLGASMFDGPALAAFFGAHV
jgi:pimeloyl-ACP methyl ester carboxylesterase